MLKNSFFLLFAHCLPFSKGGLKGEPYEKPWPKSLHECIFRTLLCDDNKSKCVFYCFSRLGLNDVNLENVQAESNGQAPLVPPVPSVAPLNTD